MMRGCYFYSVFKTRNILAKTEKERKRIYQKLGEAVNELRLYTNETKTKYMSVADKQGRLHNNSIEIGR